MPDYQPPEYVNNCEGCGTPRPALIQAFVLDGRGYCRACYLEKKAEKEQDASSNV